MFEIVLAVKSFWYERPSFAGFVLITYAPYGLGSDDRCQLQQPNPVRG
jgi:hypothetical protein